MSLRLTIILLAIALVGLAFFLFIEQPRHSRQLSEAENRDRLTEIAPPDVFGLRILRPEGTLVFARSGTEWRMIEPVDDLADQASVATLLLTLVTAKIDQQFLCATDDLPQYGLADPSAVITMTDSLQHDLVELAVGDYNLDRSYCYARQSASDEVMLLPASLRRYALRETFDFRDKKVADFELSGATRIAIDSPDHDLNFFKNADGRWMTLARGDTIVGETIAVEAVLRELRGLRAVRIVDDTPANRSRYLSRTAGRITIGFTDAPELSFVFSRPDTGWCYVSNGSSGRIEGVPATAVDVFSRTLPDFRDRRVLHFDRDHLTRIEFESGTVGVSVRKMGEQWTFSNPTYGDIDENAVTSLVSRLEELKFREILEEHLTDPAQYGLAPPALRITLFDSSNAVIDELITSETNPSRRVRDATSRSSQHLGIVDAELFVEIEQLFHDIKLH